MCRQRARPYLFSNTLAPVIVESSMTVLDLLTASTERRDKLEENTAFWRQGLAEMGYILKGETHPIVPVMLFNAKLAQDMSRDLFDEGIFAVGFFFPVVPKGQARIRTQISAGHDRHHLEKGLEAFRKVGEKHGVLGLDKNQIVEKFGL
jgi:glycine C-acetyltransferase